MNTASVSGSSLITTLVTGRKRRGRRVLGMCFCHDWVQERAAPRAVFGRRRGVRCRLAGVFLVSLECAFRRHRDKMRIIRRVKIMRLILRVFYSHSLSTRPAAMSQSNPRRSPLKAAQAGALGRARGHHPASRYSGFGPGRRRPLHHCARGREAGVSVGSVYQYFPNKAAILFRLQSDEWRQTQEMLSRILEDQARPPLARLRALVHAFVRSECEEAEMRVALSDAARSTETRRKPAKRGRRAKPFAPSCAR